MRYIIKSIHYENAGRINFSHIDCADLNNKHISGFDIKPDRAFCKKPVLAVCYRCVPWMCYDRRVRYGNEGSK